MMGDRHDEPDDAQSIAGYRVLRRAATGERAVLYLATAGAGGGAAGSGPDDGFTPSADDPPQLVMLRVYPAATDPERLAVDVEAMSGDPGSAYPHLLDVATLADGQVCLIVERLSGPSLAAILRDRTLSAGEAVTVLAPIAAELGRLARRGLAPTRLGTADVVFDGAGRPRLLGTGALARIAGDAVEPTTRIERQRESHAAFAALVGEVAQASRPTAPIDGVRALIESRLAARPFVPDPEAFERALFNAAAPSPVAGHWDGGVVRRSVAPPPSAVLLRPARALVPPADEGSHAEAEAPDGGGPLGGLARLTGDLLAVPRSDDRRSQRRVAATGSIGTRVRDAIRRRRAPLVFATLIGGAALVLALTVVPPNGRAADSNANASDESTEAGSTVVGSEAHDLGASPTPGPKPVLRDDPAAAVAELLQDRAGCLADLDLACLETVDQPGSALVAADRDAILGAREGGSVAIEAFDLDHVTVLGSMGAAWLVQVPYPDDREPASVLAMSTEAGWRLREIFD
ncbi:hypothetical protein FLP10_00390 [Agromyces intestinalis]|uniref:Protein kinase domain-containing protein n=1 Tax=Agromyces intestinalis TaxID=2592652 RepID=A0A5C1YAS8_9MICO|nr:hypothetical protein [Agromyces intestinalis]QEO13046.1 hypothetical protein FLP10_00390 [Agromyces intestinalis]